MQCIFTNFPLADPALHFPPPVAKCEPVLRAYVHGGSRGEATHSSHSVLLKDLQGLGAFATSRQHHLRLQGECGDLFAGKQLVKEEEEARRGPEFKAVNVLGAKLVMNLCKDSDPYPRRLWKRWDWQ